MAQPSLAASSFRARRSGSPGLRGVSSAARQAGVLARLAPFADRAASRRFLARRVVSRAARARCRAVLLGRRGVCRLRDLDCRECLRLAASKGLRVLVGRVEHLRGALRVSGRPFRSAQTALVRSRPLLGGERPRDAGCFPWVSRRGGCTRRGDRAPSCRPRRYPVPSAMSGSSQPPPPPPPTPRIGSPETRGNGK
jgi:hypothetical protein